MIDARPGIEKEIADELGLEIEDVQQAVNTQFKFVAKTMGEGDYRGIRLHYLGKFHVKKKRLEKQRERYMKKHGLKPGDPLPKNKSKKTYGK